MVKRRIPRSHSLRIAIACFIIAAFVLCFMDCSGGRRLTRHDYVSGGVFTAVKVADVLTTMKGLDKGAVEKNPLLGERPSDGAVCLLGLAAIGGVWLVLKYVDNPRVARAAVNIGSVITGMFVFNNLHVIGEQ